MAHCSLGHPTPQPSRSAARCGERKCRDPAEAPGMPRAVTAEQEAPMFRTDALRGRKRLFPERPEARSNPRTQTKGGSKSRLASRARAVRISSHSGLFARYFTQQVRPKLEMGKSSRYRAEEIPVLRRSLAIRLDLRGRCNRTSYL